MTVAISFRQLSIISLIYHCLDDDDDDDDDIDDPFDDDDDGINWSLLIHMKL